MKNKDNCLEILKDINTELFCLQMHQKVITENEYSKRLNKAKKLTENLENLIKEF